MALPPKSEVVTDLVRPETFDIWEYLQWIRTHEWDLFVEQMRVDTSSGSSEPVKTWVPLADLPPDVWRYFVHRFFIDRSTRVRTASELSM